MDEEPEGYRVPLRTSLTRPILMGGVPRAFAILNATIGAAVKACGGKVVTIATTAANQQLTQDTPVVQGKYQSRRVSWRELIVE